MPMVSAMPDKRLRPGLSVPDMCLTTGVPAHEGGYDAHASHLATMQSPAGVKSQQGDKNLTAQGMSFARLINTNIP
jgi:hypothetical protein